KKHYWLVVKSLFALMLPPILALALLWGIVLCFFDNEYFSKKLSWKTEVMWMVRAFRTEKDSYSGIFIGASGVKTQVIPGIVESEIAKVGGGKSFNLGGVGSCAEAYLVLRNVLEFNPRQLKWIVIDTENWPEFSIQFPDIENSVFWHNFEETTLIS